MWEFPLLLTYEVVSSELECGTTSKVFAGSELSIGSSPSTRARNAIQFVLNETYKFTSTDKKHIADLENPERELEYYVEVRFK
jgi:hypothetical protein